MRRTISLIILLSMMLHCASRLGVLSYLYENRHEIAFNLGLLEEMPITRCESDHGFSTTLKIEHQESDKRLPVNLNQAREIHLFIQTAGLHLRNENGILKEPAFTLFIETKYLSPILAIFRPPCEA